MNADYYLKEWNGLPTSLEPASEPNTVVRTNASKFERLSVCMCPPLTIISIQLDSIECNDGAEWVREMPGSHVTTLIDTDPSHAVSYDKTRQVSQVEIMESLWLPLV